MLVRNGSDYLTAFEIVLKIYKDEAVSKRDSLHSSINKHSPTITETVQVVKNEKRTENKANQLKKEALV